MKTARLSLAYDDNDTESVANDPVQTTGDTASALALVDEVDGLGSLSMPDTVARDVRTLHRLFARTMSHRIADYGIGIGQWFFLRALWDEDGLTQRELSGRTGMMEPTTVAAVHSLARRGLVKRVRHPRDGRKMNVFLTPKGQALRNELYFLMEDVNVNASEGIPQEAIQTTVQVLQKMCFNLVQKRTESTSSVLSS